MSENYIYINETKIPISDETAKNLQEKFTQPTYKRGDRFWVYGFGSSSKTKIILAQPSYYTIVAISLSSGNRWCEAVRVKNTLKITPAELERILNNRRYEKINA